MTKRINKHNHSGDGAHGEILSVRNEIKERSTTTQETTSAIVTRATAGLSTAARGQISKLKSLKKLSQRQCQVAGLAPQHRIHCEIWSLLAILYSTSFQMVALKDFCCMILAVMIIINRIVIFGRESALEILCHSPRWYADRTFKTAPLLFYQVYVILAESLGTVHPLLNCCMPTKDR